MASFEIVGVMPPGFTYPVDTWGAGAGEGVDVWVPYVPSGEDRIRGNRFGYNLHVVGRLRDGVSIEAAQARMDQITAALAAETPRWFIDRVARVEPLHRFVTGGVRRWMALLLGAAALVLLIGCVNMANLMVVRATTRTREVVIRASLGASRLDVCRLLLLESLVLSLTGAALGALAASWGVEILRAAMPAEVPRVASIAVDLRVLAVTGIAAVLTGIAFGIVPALHFSRPALAGAVARAERTSTAGAPTTSLRATLIVAQVALAMVSQQVPRTSLGDMVDFAVPGICPAWGSPDIGDALRRPVRSDVPVLLISGSLDGRCPTANAAAVRRGFPNSAAIVIDGAVHGDPLFLATPKIAELNPPS